MPKFWKSKEFEAKQKEWDRKLEESGFSDAEISKDGERFLKVRTSEIMQRGRLFNAFTGISRESSEEYFRILSQKISQEAAFEDELDRLIMERTAEGKTIKEISNELKKMLIPGQTRNKHDRNTIRYIRRRYENKWGIRIWTPFQMMSRKPHTR